MVFLNRSDGIVAPLSLRDYALNIFARRHSGVKVPNRLVGTKEWCPAARDCHQNVTTWVGLNSNLVAVRGWLLMDLTQLKRIGFEPYYDLIPHSVIRDDQSRLADITPIDPRATGDTYPFITHDGTEQEFADIVQGNDLTRIRLYPANATTFDVLYFPLSADPIQ
jgi:hypothetical protein